MDASAAPNAAVAPATEAARLAPEAFAERARTIEAEVGKVIVGQQELVRQTLVGLLANSHVLLEGVPGLGKTMLIRTIGDVIDCTFNRIQFTPDLMPADITGTNILVEEGGARVFRFQPGPVFANLVLADEINRATPRPSPRCSEAMPEHQVTVARNRYPRPARSSCSRARRPSRWRAPIPSRAQLDRFLLKVMVPFPSEDDLISIIDPTTGRGCPVRRKGATATEIVELQRLARAVPIAPTSPAYAVSACCRPPTRQPPSPPAYAQYSLRRGPARCPGARSGRQVLALDGRRFTRVGGRRPRGRPAGAPPPGDPQLRGEAEGITTEAVVRSISTRWPRRPSSNAGPAKPDHDPVPEARRRPEPIEPIADGRPDTSPRLATDSRAGRACGGRRRA